MGMPSTRDTATQLLDAAQTLVQERGFNAFSYKDLSAVVGIRTASIHYHFPSKHELGEALVARYHASLQDTLADIDREEPTTAAALKRLIDIYRSTHRRDTICLCGSLATDANTLPQPLRDAVVAYLDETERWVSAKIRNGVRSGELKITGSAASMASTLVAGLQGALILGRASGRTANLLKHVESTFFNGLKAD